MRVEQITVEEWADALPQRRTELYHMPDVLRVLDRYASGDLQLFGGFVGEELVGMLPVFVRRFPGVKAVISPPPGFSMSRMGPVVMSKSPKRRKREERNRAFTKEILDAVNGSDPLTLWGMVTSTEYTDPRPYQSAGFDVEPRFTYQLDLRDTESDEVLEGFTRDLRSEIRKLEDTQLTVDVGGAEAAVHVHDAYRKRFAEQGADFPTPQEYTRDLVATLGDRARVYTVGHPDEELFGGITVLYSNDTAYFWQGGMRANYQNLSVNSLLHWRIIEDVLSDPALDSIERYDLGRAAVQRLGRYKSKFNPDLVPYFEIRSGKLMLLAKKAYEFVTY